MNKEPGDQTEICVIIGEIFRKTGCLQTLEKQTISDSVSLTLFVLGYLDTNALPKVSMRQNQIEWGQTEQSKV